MYIIYNTPKRKYKSVKEVITNGEEKKKLIKDKSIQIKPFFETYNVISTVPDERKIFHTNRKLKIRSAE